MRAKKMSELDWPMEDTLNGEWNKTYKIDQNAPFEFKIIDNHILMRNLQKRLKGDSTLQAKYSENLDFINTLKSISIWLKLDGSVIPMTLLDVYTCFTKHLKDSSFDDQLYNCNSISFMGPMGPFKELPLVQCLNDKLIGKFLFESCLKSKIPARNLRVRTQGDIMVTHGENHELQNRLQMRQITKNGILFSCTDGMIVDNFSRSEVLKFHINTEELKKFTDNDLRSSQIAVPDFFYSEDELRYFYIDQSKVKRSLSYKSDETNEFFMFIRYCDMMESDIPSIFIEFTDKVENYFKYFLK